MLAVYRGPDFADTNLARRVAATLGLFSGDGGAFSIGNGAFYAHADDLGSANRPGSRQPRGTPPWAPTVSGTGQVILFKGWIDNAAELAAELGVAADNCARLYEAALERWTDGAEQRLIGHYCAIVDYPLDQSLRLSRSPLAAPPLHYFSDGPVLAAASVPRALLAMGLSQGLNRQKLVDTMLANPTGSEGFVARTWRVGVGEVVYLDAHSRRTVRSFDPLAPRKLPRATLRDYVAEVDRLLDEAAAAALRSGSSPGVQLSGGLDSANVAARALRALPEPARLKSFTFGPLAEWRDPGSDCFFGDERTAVKAFAAMHPRLDPHFTDNSGRGFDSDLERLFLAMGTMPGGTAPAFAFRGLFALAREQGCDLLLASDLGNFTFSNTGSWAYGEFLRRGKWCQLIRALRGDPFATRPLLRRLISRAVIPHLPDRWWRAWKRRTGQSVTPDNVQVGFVRADIARQLDAVTRARRAGTWYERDQYAWRSAMMRDQFARGDADSGDLIQGFEQVYGVKWRDVTAYRPLVEFCLGLPTEIFLHDGEQRWLARELGRGLMPEAQRSERRIGMQAADWHERLTPYLAEFRAEIARSREVPDVAEIVDLDRMERIIDDWPSRSTLDGDVVAGHAIGLMRALTAIRYIRFVTGSNQ
ncbi:MAG TPA: asparagine synthase-related protein [Novosphingobium sp.]|nr:asparagine synthase-related protein [Novosphingobium sp.]